MVRHYPFGCVFVVADGLGSKRYAAIGSRAVCTACCTAVERWVASRVGSPNDLFRLIKKLWLKNIGTHPPEDCSTTCLLGVYLNTGTLLLCQLGDGLVAYSLDGQYHALEKPMQDFSNFTHSIGQSNALENWRYETLETKGRHLQLFLATDGLSEDLLEDKIPQFLAYLADTVLPRGGKKRNPNRRMRRLLQRWDATYGMDDKTMIFFSSIEGDGLL
jgi:serine/threonine protein phosphatase PrpC